MVILDKLLRRFGPFRVTILLTLISVATSVLITVVVSLPLPDGVGATGIALSIIVPLIVTPIFGGITLRLAHSLLLAQEQLRILAITDELTQAFNRRHFFEVTAKEFARARRYNSIFSIILIDLDDFKFVNDTHGHAAGDAVLRSISDLCRREIRKADTFARYGGEEFVFLLPHTDNRAAVGLAERIRNLIASTPIQYNGYPIQCTVSVGVKTNDPNIADTDVLMLQVDQALYMAKTQGKNQIVTL